jgi:DNA mismatch repair protein MSH6
MFQEGEVNPVGTHVHNHLSFLYPPKLRDAKGNLYNSSEYDPRTLHFGPAEEAEICKLLQMKAGLTPASKQWWDIKSKYFDTILFFKTGKFYEIYNMDADIACRELCLVYMKGAIAHSGFPESAYGSMSGRLIDKGYKVARVEQTETPEQLAERKKKTSSGKKPQVVNREVSVIATNTPKLDNIWSISC